MGSEREGLTEDQRAFCETLVAIPMRGAVDSLNLGVAASLVLYEALHQRETAAAPPASEDVSPEHTASEDPPSDVPQPEPIG
jgi:tRNA C32,U32 (ribose-2'-O)-methylase TrmJ